MKPMIDTHCHLDIYPDPLAIMRQSEQQGVYVVAMSTTPTRYLRFRPTIQKGSTIRAALGIHPLEAGQVTESEWEIFIAHLSETSYIGEVGLDFSSEGLPSREQQIVVFRRILGAVDGKGKVLSIHSRRAEGTVIELLEEFSARPAIFHWYSGGNRVLDRILSSGHYCSCNPAMIRSQRGQSIVKQVPNDRLLVETDGPYINITNHPVVPSDVEVVYRYLSRLWDMSLEAVRELIYANFLRCIQYEIGKQPAFIVLGVPSASQAAEIRVQEHTDAYR